MVLPALLPLSRKIDGRGTVAGMNGRLVGDGQEDGRDGQDTSMVGGEGRRPLPVSRGLGHGAAGEHILSAADLAGHLLNDSTPAPSAAGRDRGRIQGRGRRAGWTGGVAGSRPGPRPRSACGRHDRERAGGWLTRSGPWPAVRQHEEAAARGRPAEGSVRVAAGPTCMAWAGAWCCFLVRPGRPRPSAVSRPGPKDAGLVIVLLAMFHVFPWGINLPVDLDLALAAVELRVSLSAVRLCLL